MSPGAGIFKQDAKYGRAIELVSRSEQKLLDRLGADGKDLFQKYIGMQGEVHQLTAVNNLVYGFKLGLMMTAETFIGMDSLYISGEDD